MTMNSGINNTEKKRYELSWIHMHGQILGRTMASQKALSCSIQVLKYDSF